MSSSIDTSAADAAVDFIILRCVTEARNLRVKFESYTDHEGKVHTGVYDNSLNTQFPSAIRKDGRRFKIKSCNLTMSKGKGRAFYRVTTKDIHILDEGTAEFDATSVVVYGGFSECCICLTGMPETIFAPCGHCCCCAGCGVTVRKGKKCPICRRDIQHAFPLEA